MRVISTEELRASGRQFLDCYEDIGTLFLSEARCFFPALVIRHTKTTSSTCLHSQYAGAKEGESRLGHLLEGVIRAINHHPLLLGGFCCVLCYRSFMPTPPMPTPPITSRSKTTQRSGTTNDTALSKAMLTQAIGHGCTSKDI